MSVLFTPRSIGRLELPNRLVCSATYEQMAAESGEVTDKLIRRYEKLALGETALSITGLMYVHPSGRGYQHQVGIHADSMIAGLSKLTAAVHAAGGRIAFQLAHCGRQTTKAMAGQTPMAPSSRGRDPMNFVKPRTMSEEDIEKTIAAFGAAAKRAVAAGADAIQLHGAHGYLISEFLSPFFNVRTDRWGGSDENRFRFLKSVYQAVKAQVPEDFPILVKLNGHDHTPKAGVTLTSVRQYTQWLAEMGIDGIEVSCGTTHYSYMNMCRGDVPTTELMQSLAWWEKPVGRFMIGKLEGHYDLEEGYNLAFAKAIKPLIGD
nr:NADH:flavin oxidoreductase [Desulfobacterales bacterium]